MAINDHEFFAFSPDVSLGAEVVHPIHGAASIFFHKAPVGSNRHGAFRRLAPAHPDPVTGVVGVDQVNLRSGALTMAFLPKRLTESGAVHTRYGILFLMDRDEDPTDTSSNVQFYLAGFDTHAHSGAGAWGIWRYSGGSFGANPVTLWQSDAADAPAIAHDSPFIFGVEWRQDPTFIRGVQLFLRADLAPNLATPYDHLTLITTQVDLATAGALMGASFGEGAGYESVSGNGELHFCVDRIRGEGFGTGDVNGQVWLDDNADGIHDAGEGPYLGGGNVVITDLGGAVHTVPISTVDGTYRAQHLALGFATTEIDPASLPAAYGVSSPNLPQTVTITHGGNTNAPDMGVKPAP